MSILERTRQQALGKQVEMDRAREIGRQESLAELARMAEAIQSQANVAQQLREPEVQVPIQPVQQPVMTPEEFARRDAAQQSLAEMAAGLQ